MSVTAASTTTTMVNGFACKNCTDIDYAKKHIDPAHPKDGPYGVNAKAPDRPRDAFRLDGALAAQTVSAGGGSVPQAGRLLNLSV